MKLKIYFLFITLCSAAGISFAQTQVGLPWTGAYGITQTVAQIIAQDTGNHIYTGNPIFLREHETHLQKANNPASPKVKTYPYPSDVDNYNGGAERSNVPTQTIGVNFLASTISNTVGYIPPDCNGAAGPTQIMAVANGRIRVFNKTGTLGGLDVTTDAFFTSVRNGSSISDTHIRYDRLTAKWFVVAINVASTNNRVVIAVSSGPTITNGSSFTFFYFDFTLVSPAGDNGKFLDYPTFGVDANALYIGGVRFNPNNFDGCPVFVVRKTSVTGGGPIVITAFRNAGGTTSGIYVPQGVDNDDPTATEGYFIGTDAGVYGKLNITRVSTPGGTPSITNLTGITIPANNSPVLQYSQGAAANRRLDGLDDRLFAAHIMKNKLTGVSSLWTAHATRVNSAGIATGTMDRNATRYYQLGSLTTTPVLLQSGTLYDGAASNPQGFWIPSVAMSGQGHAVIAYSTAGQANYANAAVSGRYSVDAAGLLQSFVLATASSTAYNVQTTDGQRWGDYSQVVIDPNDNMTMWTFQEYCNSANSWGVRVFSLKAPTPPPTGALNALATVGIASSIPVSIVANSTPGNTGFFDPGPDVGGPGYANHITASATGGITMNSVTFVDSMHVNLSINTSLTAPGVYTITITNPDGQTTTIPITVVGALPVELVSFTAQIAGNACDLNWMTASEFNNNFFDVEKSVDGNTFEKCGQVAGSGNSSVMHHYSFTDANPYPGVSYYRLNQVDYDGATAYSQVVGVDFGKNDFFLVSTHLDESNLSIVVTVNDNATESVRYRLTEITGREICSGVVAEQTGINSFSISCKNLSQGIYYISLDNGSKLISGKVFYH